MVLFSESQRPAAWGYALLLGIALLPTLGVTCGVAQSISSGHSSWILMLFGLVFPAALVWLALSLHLQTEVRSDGLYVKFGPFHRAFRRFAFVDIASMNLRAFDPISEYGGWGLKQGAAGRCFTMRGRVGLQLVLKSGERMLIGTQRSEDLNRALKTP